jgi:hypothetical protein
MSRQIVDIGIEGNDGTGDSIRESFRKTNENFQELYAVFGLGGQISITNMSDVPDTLEANKVLIVNSTGTAVTFSEFASDSALDSNDADTIQIDTLSIPGKIILTTTFGQLEDDTVAPTLGNHLNANGFAMGGVEISDAAADAINALPGNSTTYTIDDLVAPRKHLDQRYAPKGADNRISTTEPSASDHILTVTQYQNNNAYIASHGITSQQNGLPFVFDVTFTAPTNLVDGTTYYVRYVNDNELALFATEADAKSLSATALNNKILIGNTAVASEDSHTLTDAAYDSSLAGNWLNDQALPRDAVVRRQGDTMTGALYLNDHPGELAGSGTPNGAADLQAASKFYVDNKATSSSSIVYVSPLGDDLQTNTPAGKEGSSLSYAFKTLGAAAEHASELVSNAQETTGPYVQTLTHTNFTVNSTVSSASVATAQAPNADDKIKDNKEYLVEELKGFVQFTYPNYSFDERQFDRDYGDLIESFRFDLNRGTNANTLTKRFAQKFYSKVNSRVEIKQFLTENNAAVDKLYDIINDSIFENRGFQEKTVSGITKKSGNVAAVVTTTTNHGLVDGNLVKFTDVAGMTEINNQFAYAKVVTSTTFELYTDSALTTLFDNSAYTDFTNDGNARSALRYQQYYQQDTTGANVNSTETTVATSLQTLKDLVKNVWENGADVAQEIVHGEKYKIVLVNSGGQLDQTDSDNVDALPSKLVRGKTSGAIGQITSFENDATPGFTDFYINMLSPLDFIVGEEVEYGYKTVTKQVTIQVEGGVFEEDFPIKIPANTSVIGSEFRRTVIKPRDGVSQSSHASAYFYRDNEFDGLTVATEGVAFNDQQGNEKGKVGRHYLYRADRAKNVGSVITNTGSYTTAANILLENKEYIVEESLRFLDTNYSSVTYDAESYRTDFRALVDALADDLRDGGDANSLVVQGSYHEVGNTDYLSRFGDSSTEVAVEAAIDNLAVLANNLLSATAPVYTDGSYTAGNSTVTDIVSPNLSLGSGESGTTAIVAALTDKINFVFSIDYNPPLRNCDIDAFLLNDASTVENITVQGHKSFAMVLDPNGQVLTKAPYIANSSSLTQSTNTKLFAGGVYADAYAGNIPVKIRGNSGTFDDGPRGTVSLDAFTLWVESEDVDVIGDSTSLSTQGLKLKEPQVPAVFYVGGVRYQVNAISNYDQDLGRCIVYLDASANGGTGYTGSVDVDTYIQSGGSRSVEISNFAQANDLAYGIAGSNGAQITANSIESTYTQAAFYAADGTDIKVSNSTVNFGKFGLVADGADPNEIPDDVDLIDNSTQAAKAYVDANYTGDLGDGAIAVYDCAAAPMKDSIITIDHSVAGTLNYRVTSVTDITAASPTPAPAPTVLNANVYQLQLVAEDSAATDFYGTLQEAVTDDTIVEIRNGKQSLYDNVASPSTLNPRPNTTVTYDESADVGYKATAFATTDNYGNALAANRVRATFDTDYKYIELIPNTTHNSGGFGSTANDTKLAIEVLTGGAAPFLDSTRVVGKVFAHAGKSHYITTYKNVTTLEMASAVSFTAGDTVTQAVTGATGTALKTVASGTTVHVYDVTGTFDTTNTVSGVVPNTVTVDNFAYVEFNTSDASVSSSNIHPSPQASGLNTAITTTRKLFAGVPTGADASVVENTAIIRSTNTVFKNVGAGSFNETNYPNDILGDPENTQDPTTFTDSPAASTAEVWERGQGRVFWTSTDQYGVFRVGQFFNVDQATGDTTIEGGVGISNAVSLGFSSGTTVNEFSTDTSMSGVSDSAVPTEKAVKTYIDRRLHLDETGTVIAGGDKIGPGYLDLEGNATMAGDLNMGSSFRITNLTTNSGVSTDAANVAYVNSKVAEFDSISELADTSISSAATSDFLVYNGSAWEDAAVTGDVTLTRTGANVITSAIATGAIVNDDVNASAAIAQSKLALDDATTSTKGIASFNSTHFTVSSGAVDIAANSIAKADFEQIATSTVLGRTTAGTGNVEEIAISSLISAGGAVVDADFTTDNTGSKVLTQVAAGSYGLTNLSATTSNNSVVKRSATGEVDATAYQIDGNQILDVDGTDTVLKTTAGGVLLRGEGATPVLETGSVQVGDIANVDNSTFQDASSYSTSTSKLASTWIYTNFLEAATEKGSGGTGIGLGAGGGFAESAADVIIAVTNGVVRTVTNNSGLEVIGSLTTTDITTGGSATAGTITGNWSLTVGSRFEATYADIAEYYEADKQYEVGTVLVFGGDKEVTESTEHRTTRIAGVVSDNAAFTMNQDCPGIAVCIGLVGRIPVKVIGQVRKGDMLVASAIPGYAIVDNNPTVGTVLGRAIGEKTDSDKGVVEVLVGK